MTDTALDTGVAPVAGPTRPAPRRRCKVRRILDTLPDDRAARVLHLLHLDARDPDEPGWTDRALAKAIRADTGEHLDHSMLSTHRTHTCICTTPENEDA